MPQEQPDANSSASDVIAELRRQRDARPCRGAPVRRPAAGSVAVPEVDSDVALSRAEATDEVQPIRETRTQVAPGGRRAPVDGRQVTWFVRVSAEVEELAVRRLGEMQARGLRSSKTELTEALLQELEGRSAKELIALVEHTRAR